MTDILLITARWESSGRHVATIRAKPDGSIDAFGGEHHRILSKLSPPPSPSTEGVYRCLERVLQKLRAVDEEFEDDPIGIDTTEPDWIRKMAERAVSGVNRAAVDAEIARVEERLGISEIDKSWWGRLRFRLWLCKRKK